ncbi:hypothetical protein BDY17DRAFT_39263 [Neohortaea acidophila]|uniref:Secreted protein n=1 Tax=Neohortaea acidophila TaxID=245834 RepID=A0A6A6PHJ1_9PEZI|nr:uncharacterized protein BDY17DRAFT_39263 [Neohortaea acidophila]KAF2479469.1 hypothetical protein BDY17DRAFT_39263 [Neohortaea acidophila]
MVFLATILTIEAAVLMPQPVYGVDPAATDAVATHPKFRCVCVVEFGSETAHSPNRSDCSPSARLRWPISALSRRPQDCIDTSVPAARCPLYMLSSAKSTAPRHKQSASMLMGWCAGLANDKLHGEEGQCTSLKVCCRRRERGARVGSVSESSHSQRGKALLQAR